MKLHPPTLALVAIASGLLASAYLIRPAPGATVATIAPAPKSAAAAPARAVQLAVAAAEAPKPSSSIKVLQAPVPLKVSAHSEYFTPSADTQPTAVPDGTATTGDKPANGTAALQADDAVAKNAIEQDGYRDVRKLVKGPDGSWRGRAMRGSTEIAVKVDADGSVAAD